MGGGGITECHDVCGAIFVDGRPMWMGPVAAPSAL